jgi:hypothetical protein
LIKRKLLYKGKTIIILDRWDVVCSARTSVLLTGIYPYLIRLRLALPVRRQKIVDQWMVLLSWRVAASANGGRPSPDTLMTSGGDGDGGERPRRCAAHTRTYQSIDLGLDTGPWQNNSQPQPPYMGYWVIWASLLR